jgi:ubiquinone/menaquinone biosynthesis C-methylase UbiE
VAPERPAEFDRYKASSLRAYNERLPDRYDRSIAVRFFGLSRMDDFVLDVLGPDVRESAILDVGCATGRLLERLARAGARQLAGSDLAPRILEVARSKLCRLHVEADLQRADAETALPWPSRTFDVVTLTGVMHHFLRPQAALKEIRRVLRSEGRLIMADVSFFPPLRELFNLCLRVHPHDGDCHFRTGTQVQQLLRACGWEVRRSQRISWWGFGVAASPAS